MLMKTFNMIWQVIRQSHSCTGKFGSPELELDQREDLVQKMTGLGQKVGCTNL